MFGIYSNRDHSAEVRLNVEFIGASWLEKRMIGKIINRVVSKDVAKCAPFGRNNLTEQSDALAETVRKAIDSVVGGTKFFHVEYTMNLEIYARVH